MNMTVYINSKQVHFVLEVGWFKGDCFSLFNLTLCEKPDYLDFGLDVLRLKIAKFVIYFGFHEYGK